MKETILTNARLVLPAEVVLGTVVLRGAAIAEIQPGRSHLPGAEDLAGDHLIPGIVDVHTDNLERQVLPRANARWPSRSAMLAHDAQCAAAGVTTVLDALCLGDLGFDRLGHLAEQPVHFLEMTKHGAKRHPGHFRHTSGRRRHIPAANQLDHGGYDLSPRAA